MLIEEENKIIHVLKRKISDGGEAIAVFNLGETVENVKGYFDETVSIRDVWAKKDLKDADMIKLIEMHRIWCGIQNLKEKNRECKKLVFYIPYFCITKTTLSLRGSKEVNR